MTTLISRRKFLYLSVVGMAGAAGYFVSFAGESAARPESMVRSPAPTPSATATPSATPPPIPDAPSLATRLTSNDDFFIPNPARTATVSLDNWSLQLTGAVERPLTIGWADLLKLPSVSEERTVSCISNPTNGKQIANALWTGVPLSVLMDKAGVLPEIKKVVYHCADEYTTAVPASAIRDWDALLAYRMNGQPLPVGHGYPVRMLVPNLYGWKSPKWLTGLEFVANEEWKPESQLEPFSMIEEPQSGIISGRYLWLNGIAFAGMTGLATVEVSTDSGQHWRQAELSPDRTPGVWAAWRYLWEIPGSGRCVLAARARDGAGQVELVDGAIHSDAGSELHTREVNAQ